jgi:hypothetical protein
VDLSGNGNDVTTNSAVTLVADRFGNPGLAGGYNGSAFMEVASDAVLPVGTAPRTVSVWIQTNHDYSSGSGGIFNWGSSAAAGERFGEVVLTTNDDYFVGENADLTGTHVLNDNGWHNIIVTYDGSVVSVWVDAFYSISGTPAPALNTTGQFLEIGRSSVDHPTPEPFFGNIDDLRIYDRVLSEDERGQLFLEGGWH